MKDMNPFFYGGVVYGDHFCNRSEELAEIRRDIHAGLNILLYAPRRFGKTSLVVKALEGLEGPAVYFDMMRVIDEREFVQKYFRAVSASMERSSDRLIRLLKRTLHFRPNVTAVFDDSGSPSLSLSLAPGEEHRVLDDVLALPLHFAQHRNTSVTVVFDEFQDVARLGIEAKLRSIIQHHGARVSYLFLGSKKSIMEQIFKDSRTPFYRSVKHIPIGPIAREEWMVHIRRRFCAGGKTISDHAIDRLLDVTGGFPHYTQQLAYELYAAVEHAVDDAAVDAAITTVTAREEDFLLNEWESLSTNQKRALKLIVEAGPTRIYAHETLTRYRLSASALRKAVAGLIAKDVIDRGRGGWYVQDPLLAHYVRVRL